MTEARFNVKIDLKIQYDFKNGPKMKKNAINYLYLSNFHYNY